MNGASFNDWSKLYDREDILKYLPFRDFGEREEIYATTDDAFGLVLECSPLITPSINIENALESAFSLLPDDCYIQVILFASPNVTKALDTWEFSKTRANDDELSKSIVQSYKNFIETKTSENISNSFMAPVRNFKLVITIKIGGKNNSVSLFDNLFSLQPIKRFFSNKTEIHTEVPKLRKNLNALLQVKDRFMGSLKKAYMNPRIMTPNSLIEFVYEILNANHDFRDIPKWDGSYINNFIFANDNSVLIKDEECIIDKKHFKTLSVKEYPEEWGLVDVLKYAGDTIGNQNHSSPFIISLNIEKLGASAKDSIVARSTLTNGQNMPYSLFPKLKYIHRDLTYGMDKLQKGLTPYFVTLQVAIIGNSEKEVEDLSGQYKAYFKTLAYSLEYDRFVTFPALISMLPLGFDSKIQEFLSDKRGRIVFSENVVSMAPTVADWYGLKPEIPMVSPRGQWFGMDLFANKAGGFNAFVVGMTGSGKSVFLQWIALNYYLSSNKIWIIDIGRSYEKLCHIFGGQFIEFSKENPISLNPFSNLTDWEMLEEYMEFLTNLYLLMGLPKELQLSEQLEKLMKQYLLDAIKMSYTDYRENSDVDTIVEKLRLINELHKDDRLSDFIKHLKPFQKGYVYGEFLNGRSTINFNNDMVVLECDGLEGMPDLLSPVLMVLTFQISKEIYLGEKTKTNHNKRNIVIMDEGHKFLKGSTHVDLFIEQAYRRFRKHGASMILGTQGFEDLYGGDSVSKVGRVIIENSYWNFFLMQKSTSRQKIKTSGYFNLSDYENSLMDTTEPVDGEYGEVLILSDKVTTKGRIVLDEFLQTMLFTNAETRSRITQHVAQGKTYLEAVKSVQREECFLSNVNR